MARAPEPSAPAAEGDPEPRAEEPIGGTPAGPASHEAPRIEIPQTPPDPSRSLPEVTVRHLGMHIGGGPNDDASKAPFLRAIEPQFEQFLACYREVDEPLEGGSFGVDFFIKRAGGSPDLRQPRTGMRGDAFRECMLEALSSVTFGRPPKGPTVVSYSVKFDVRDPTEE